MELHRSPHIQVLRIATVLAIFAVCPSAVRASCGDWLDHSGGTAESSQGEERPADTLPSRTPCQGLACENSPSGPSPLSPSEIRPPLPKDFAWEAIVEVDPPRMRDGRHSVEKPHPNAGCPLGVDRPPEALIPLS